jgi:hypothetical protein
MSKIYVGGLKFRLDAKTDFISLAKGDLIGSESVESVVANMVALAKRDKKNVAGWVQDGKGDVTVKLPTKSGKEFAAMGFKPATVEKLMTSHNARILFNWVGYGPMPYLAFFPKTADKTVNAKTEKTAKYGLII